MKLACTGESQKVLALDSSCQGSSKNIKILLNKHDRRNPDTLLSILCAYSLTTDGSPEVASSLALDFLYDMESSTKKKFESFLF